MFFGALASIQLRSRRTQSVSGRAGDVAREKQMKQALLKMKCVLEIGWEFSGVGRLCIDSMGTPTC